MNSSSNNSNRQVPYSAIHHFSSSNPTIATTISGGNISSSTPPSHAYRQGGSFITPSSSILDLETEPVEETSRMIDYILYYESGNLESEKLVDLVKNNKSLSQITFHDVGWIKRNQMKYPWFARRGIKGVPSIYDKKTGKVYGDGNRDNTALSFLEKLLKEAADASHQRLPLSSLPRQQQSNQQMILETMFAKISAMEEQLAKKNIDDLAYQAKVLSFISTSSTIGNHHHSSLRSPALLVSATTNANLPHEIPAASSKVSAFRSGGGSPPSSPPSSTSVGEPGKQRIKIERRPNKLMAPIYAKNDLPESGSSLSGLVTNGTLSEEDRKKREKEMERQEMDRQQNMEDLERFFGSSSVNDDTKTIFVDDPPTIISSSRFPKSNISNSSNNNNSTGKKINEEKLTTNSSPPLQPSQSGRKPSTIISRDRAAPRW